MPSSKGCFGAPVHGHEVRVKTNPRTFDSDPSITTKGKRSTLSSLLSTKYSFKLPTSLQWIRTNWTMSKIKPAIRCTIAAWICLVLFVIPSVEIFMGQASFLILIASFLSPPSDPFMAVLERETLIMVLVSVGWAWSCLGMKLASLARVNIDYNASTTAIFRGDYVEAAPSVILLVFIFFGCFFFLYIRAHQGVGPYTFPTVLACIGLDITITTGILFPYPYYTIGKAIVIPLGLHSCISLLCSVLVFPQSVSAQFTTQLQNVLTPLTHSLSLHQQILKMQTDSPEFADHTSRIITEVKKSESTLIPLAAAGRLLPSDLFYGRFAPQDFRALQKLARRMAVRANGMTIYFQLIDPTREKFPTTPAPSRPGTPGTMSPRMSRAPSLERITDLTHTEKDIHRDPDEDPGSDNDTAPGTPTGSTMSHSVGMTGRRSRRHNHSRHMHHQLHHSLLHLSLPKVHRHEHAVGVFESQRYLDLENNFFRDPGGDAHVQRTAELLSDCCGDLLDRCRKSTIWIHSWLGDVRSGRLNFWVKHKERESRWKSKFEELKELREGLVDALAVFKKDSRHTVLEPYRAAFERTEVDEERLPPSHRYLFHCYVYQYHLMRFSSQTIDMLDVIIALEEKRRRNRIWTPVQRIFKWSNWQLTESHDDDEDPDTIQGLEPAAIEDLGLPRRRDPDALPPSNAFEWVMSHLYHICAGIGGGNALYALKAALLTVVMCLPSALASAFAYENKFVWAIFMGQLTLARFRGDTTFGWSARVFSTFFGGIVGMVMWYISCGNGHGNAFGLAAVCAVCFPFLFYIRLYRPGPPMITIIFLVTAVLVMGYSYQDLHVILPSSPGVGFAVFWRRFVLVVSGVTAAFIFSFLPPTRTIRRYQRATLATTCSELAGLYCAILSFAHSRREKESAEIVTGLIATRSKLNRSAALKTNVMYEYSLRGKWPAKRYQTILDLQLQLAYSLSHLMSIIEHLEPSWTRAFLRRTRFVDSDFQGDVLAVITMISTSLRTGIPLPQITPCPLLDRYMLKYHGLNVIHTDAEEDYGLPRTLTLETLQNEQYLMFCVGVSTAFAIVSRLDRLMLAVKEIVGEQYHINGVGLGISGRTGVELGSRTNTWNNRALSHIV